MTPLNFDVAVLGNGVVGWSLARALRLQDAGVRVAVVGPPERTGAATLAAGAMLGTFGEVTAATFASPAWREKLELSLQARSLWDDWVAGINEAAAPGPEVTVGRRGTHVILNTRSSAHDDRNFDAILRALKDHREPYELNEPETIHGYEPVDDERSLKALYIPNEGWIDPNALLAALEATAARDENLVPLHWIATEIQADNGGFRVLSQDGEEIATDQVVLAAGAATQQLIARSPVVATKIPPVLCGVGTSIVTRSETVLFDHVLRTPNRGGACGLHAVPRPGATYLGAGNILALEPSTRARLRDVYELVGRATEQLSRALSTSWIESIHVGNRPITLDTLPALGSAGVPGIWVATGTYRDGLNDSPAIATALATEILGGARTLSSEFEPVRQPHAFMSADECVAAAAEQLRGYFYEHGLSLRQRFDGLVEEAMLSRVQSLWASLDTTVALQPDILIMLAWDPKKAEPVRRWLAERALGATD
jgi:glycine oxidase